jgi:hypothetical protein
MTWCLSEWVIQVIIPWKQHQLGGMHPLLPHTGRTVKRPWFLAFLRKRLVNGLTRRFRGNASPIDGIRRDVRSCRRQGLPGSPWCAGVPVRRACRMGTVPLAVELIESHGAGGEREPGRDARMPPGSRTGLRNGRAAGRVPADPRAIRGREADASSESSSRPGFRQAAGRR